MAFWKRRSFTRLVDPVFDDLARFARRLARDPEDAEDVLQEALIVGLRRLDGLRADHAFRVWMHRVLYTTWLDRRDREARHRRRVEAAADAHILRFPCPAERLADRRLGEALVMAIEALPDPQREAVWLVDVQGMSFSEAAAVLGIKRGTVASRVARARAVLRVELAEVARERGVI